MVPPHLDTRLRGYDEHEPTARGSRQPLRSALARGQWTQIVLDSRTSGTLCGKGGPYAFWVRLAPSGANPARVVDHLAGGGVCLFQADCAGVIPSLFEARSDTPPGSG